MSFFAEQTNIPLSFSYHNIQLRPLRPVLNTLCHYDLPDSKTEIIDLEKTPGKAVRMVKGMDQLYKSSTTRDTNAKMQKHLQFRITSSSFLQAGKGCSAHTLFVHCPFEQPATAQTGPAHLLAQTKRSHAHGVAPYGNDKYFFPLLIQVTFLIFMQIVAVFQPTCQDLGTSCLKPPN